MDIIDYFDQLSNEYVPLDKHIFFEHILLLMRLINVVFILLLVLMTSAQCQQTVENWFNKGLALYDQGKYDDAIKCFDETVKLDPNYADAWLGKAIALDDLGKYDEAILAYDEAISLDPNNARAWNNKGVALGKQGNTDEAVEAFDEAIRLDPNYAAARNNKGAVLEALERDTEASTAFAKTKESQSHPGPVSSAYSANAQSPQNEPLNTSGAVGLSNMNEMQLYENAQYSFGMSHPTNWIAQEPDPNDQGIVVGFLAPGEDVNSPATYLFIQIEKLPSGKKITLEQYGQAMQKNLKAAMPDLKILTEGDISIGGQPGHAIVYNLASQDGTFRVLKAWTLHGEKAYSFTYNSPDDRYDEFAGDISKMIGSLNFEPTQINNNYLPKSEVLDQTSMNDPLSEANWYNKGIALYGQGKYDEAIQAFDEAIEINPQNADTWNNKGTALANLGKYDEAIQAFNEAIALDPKYAYAWYSKGNALVNLGKYDEAIKAYDKAIEINPRDARAWNNKGYALKMLGRTTASDLAYAMAKELG